MIYELRIYYAVPGRLPALNQRFEHHTLRVWEKHQIRPVGFWTTLIGPSNTALTHMLQWDNLADREKKWNAFIADPEWLAVRQETEKDGPLIERAESQLLTPTSYSNLK